MPPIYRKTRRSKRTIANVGNATAYSEVVYRRDANQLPYIALEGGYLSFGSLNV